MIKKQIKAITLQIIINSKIIIVNYKDVPTQLEDRFKKLFSKVNPLRAMMKKQGLPSAHLPLKIFMYDYYERPGKDYYAMRIDRGQWQALKKAVDDYNTIGRTKNRPEVILSIKVSTTNKPVDIPPFKLTLEDYQEAAHLKALGRNQGVISFPPGGGKTILAASLIGKLKQRTLVVVHTEQLATQWCESLGVKSFDGIKIGKFFGGLKEQGEHVTIATVQSLTDYEYKDSIYSGYGCVILDECHHVPADTFRAVVGNSSATYRFGLTASLKRKDRKEFLMTSTFGETLVALTYDDIKDRIILPRVIRVNIDDCPNDLVDIDKIYTLRKGELALDYTKMYTWMTTSLRNAHIFKILDKCIGDKDAITLILTKRREHAKILSDYVEAKGEKCGYMVGGGTAAYKRRKTKMLEDARNGKLRFLVGTSLADEGLDVVTLNRLVLTMPSSFDELLRQRLGRISRKTEGKEVPIVYDIVDTYIPELINSWYARNRLHKSLNLEVTEIGVEDLE